MSESKPSLARWFPLHRVAVLLWVATVWGTVVMTPSVGRILGHGGNGRFFDLQGSLAAGEAARHGFNPYEINPLDPYGRPHLYSSWWLLTGRLGLVRTDSDWLGACLVAATLLTAMIVWPVRTRSEALLAGAVLVSPAWLLAVSRANNDLVIFILLAGTVRAFHSASAGWRRVGAALAGTLAILKYFPLASCVGLLGAACRREAILGLGIVAIVIAAGWSSLEHAVHAIGAFGPQSSGLQAFGSRVLGEALSPGTSGGLGLMVGILAAGCGYALTARHGRSIDDINGRWQLGAAVAGGVFAACFVLGTSYSYKLVFLWWWWPWLVHAAQDAPRNRRPVALLALLLVVHWSDGVAAGAMNYFGPIWSYAQRAQALGVGKGIAISTQLGYWVLCGAGLGWTIAWSRRQAVRLGATT